MNTPKPISEPIKHQNNWDEYIEKTVPEIFIKAGKPVLFKRVSDIQEYTNRLGLPVLENIVIEKFYSPLTNRFYSNPQEQHNMYDQVNIAGKATLFLARNPKKPQIKDIRVHDLFIAGVQSLQQDYLIASTQQENGLLTPNAIRLTDILQYHPHEL